MRTQNVIFREYDIRGIVGEELIIDEVYELARAIAFYLVEKNPQLKMVAIGMDGREHSPAIKEQVCRGLMDSGLDVVFIGLCTSPMIYFATYTISIDAAIMVTASHNPKEYNGLKICLGKHSLSGEKIRQIGQYFNEKKHVTAQVKGTYSENFIKDAYIEWHLNEFKHLKNIPLSMVIDCGNGSAGTVIPEIVQKMDWKNAHLLCTDVDPTFPNHTADPTKIENMKDVRDAVVKTEAVVGIGFDGDADRMGAMTNTGELISGDKLLVVFAQPMVQKNPGMRVVCNVVCSSGVGEVLSEWGAETIITPVGHSVVEDAMITNHALLGGETSCHFFFKDRHFGYDDGVYAMFRLIELLIESGKSVSQLLDVFPSKVTSPEYRITCTEEAKYAIVQEAKGLFFQRYKQYKIEAIDGVKVTTDYGWGLLRASNTQPVLSIRFEANSQEDLNHIKEDFVVILCHYFDQAYLREQFQM